MAEASQIIFDYKEVVEALVKKQGIHEGIWTLYIEFGLAAVNIEAKIGGDIPNSPPSNITPAAIVTIQKIGIIKSGELTNISVDAAKVNPKPQAGSQKKKVEAKRK